VNSSWTTSLRRLSLRFPVTWLAGWHIAVAICVLGTLLLATLFSPWTSDLTQSARRDLGGMWVFASALAALALVARTFSLTRDTSLTTSQRLRLFVSSSAMLCLFGTQPVAWIVGSESLMSRGMNFLNWGRLVEFLVTSTSFAVSLGMALVSVAVLSHGSSRARMLVSASLFVSIAGVVSSGFISAVLIDNAWLGLVFCTMLFFTPWLVALSERTPLWLGRLVVAPADVALFSALPLYAATSLVAAYAGNEVVFSDLSRRANWSIAGVGQAVFLTLAYSLLIYRQPTARAHWGDQ
jgi:hypothetical protein